jgi:hypothetical protein
MWGFSLMLRLAAGYSLVGEPSLKRIAVGLQPADTFSMCAVPDRM